MIRLLIVDDEPFIVNGLYEYMLLGSGLELDVYKAFSGDEAIDWLERTNIDIVISDIRMPSMSGLQLLDRIKKSWPHCKVILLTGFDEFEYIYQAIQYEGVRYLLKTEGYEKILSLVRDSITDIESMRRSEELIAQANRQMKLAIPIVQKDLLLGLLKGERLTVDLRLRRFEQLDIPLNAREDVYLVHGRLESHGEQTESVFRVKMAADRYFDAGYAVFFLTAEHGGLIWIVQPIAVADRESRPSADKVVGQIRGILELVLDTCEESLGFPVHFIVDGSAVPWDRLADRYAVLRSRSGRMPAVGGRGSIVEYGPDEATAVSLPTNAMVEAALRQLKKMDLLGGFLESGHRQEFMELLEEMLQCADRALEIRQPHTAMSLYCPLSLLIRSYIHTWKMEDRLKLHAAPILQLLTDPIEAMPERIGELFRQAAPLLFEWRKLSQETGVSSAIAAVQQFIQEHLEEDLSLVRLSEISRLNPSYLSRLFKQVTGVNLNVYIMETRLGKAMELLRDSDYKVYEIAKRVGYEYAPYFTKTFRKYAHMSPQEYRDCYQLDVNKA